MGLFQVVCLSLLAAFAWAQELQSCMVDSIPVSVGSTEDAAALATSLQCSNGDFAVEWVGEVFVEETIFVTDGTSLNVTGAGPGAIADGGGETQLFVVEGDSRLHLSDMTLSNGNASYGGAIFVNQSTVSFSGNMSFISNSAEFGGAIVAWESNVSWNGYSTQFTANYAAFDGGAIGAYMFSVVSWEGNGTLFSSNKAESEGGAIVVWATVFWDGGGTQFISNYADLGGAISASESSTVSWDGDGTLFISNYADTGGGAIFAFDATVFWDGDGTQFISNSGSVGGGAITAFNSSTLSWDGDGTEFISNVCDHFGGAISAWDSTVSWGGDGTLFSNNSAGEDGGAIFAYDSSTVSWVGDDTQFSNNSAGHDGGAICVSISTVFLGENTTFSSNSAGRSGGALAMVDIGSDPNTEIGSFIGTVYSDNRADRRGGDILVRQSDRIEFHRIDISVELGWECWGSGRGVQCRGIVYSCSVFEMHLL